ncbi:ATPase [Magnetovirga frankeli]|uniref:ATP synthase subunit C n=1 Tax=Magnetovirga frankeli TaxID=947516 RepID=UPI00129397CD|nr:ATPase [gamma proteobacterium SS-5]
MITIATLLGLSLLGVILSGLYLDRHPLPAAQTRRWLGPSLLGNALLFFAAQLALLGLGIAEVHAASEELATAGRDFSLGTGLVYIGIALPTAVSTVAAALAVGPIGAAALAAITEKPEIFGRTLVYLGLAEGIAIYGLVLSILLVDKL